LAIHPPSILKPGQSKQVRSEANCARDDAAREEAARARVSAAKCELVAEVARDFGEVRMRVMGLSMFPCLLPGDIVTVERRAIEEFRPGEIAKYLRDGRLMVHRVIEMRDGKLITRGDVAMENDPPVGAEEVVGKVVSVDRGGARFEPSSGRGWRERAMARMARHSPLAARFLLLFLTFKRRPTPTERAALCQN
jgi:hypothetical protein